MADRCAAATSDQSSCTSANRVLLVFQIADRTAALSISDVERITPIAELAHPPGMPLVLEGLLDLAGTAAPVLRMDRLFELPAQHIGLYSMLVVLKSVDDSRVALLVDRVSRVATVPADALVPVTGEGSFNGCVEATVRLTDEVVHVLSPARLLTGKERAVLAEFLRVSERRQKQWEVDKA